MQQWHSRSGADWLVAGASEEAAREPVVGVEAGSVVGCHCRAHFGLGFPGEGWGGVGLDAEVGVAKEVRVEEKSAVCSAR